MPLWMKLWFAGHVALSGLGAWLCYAASQEASRLDATDGNGIRSGAWTVVLVAFAISSLANAGVLMMGVDEKDGSTKPGDDDEQDD
jgi:hypothetical protein